MLLHQETLMLRSQVIAPLAGELKLPSVLHRLLQDIHALRIGQADKLRIDYRLQAGNQALIYKLIQELQVVLAVSQCPAYAVLDEVLLQVHQLVFLDESHLGLNHPKLCQVARRVGVLGAEGRTEGVYLALCHSR